MKDLYVIDKEWLDNELIRVEKELDEAWSTLNKVYLESRRNALKTVQDNIKPYLDHVKQVCSYDTITHTHPETLGNDTGSPKEG